MGAVAVVCQKAAVCHLPDHGSEWAPPPVCTGSFEVRLFELPGWNATAGPAAQFPGWSRVNHAKYIVADNRVNVGTSNMAWGYNNFVITFGQFLMGASALRRPTRAVGCAPLAVATMLIDGVSKLGLQVLFQHGRQQPEQRRSGAHLNRPGNL